MHAYSIRYGISFDTLIPLLDLLVVSISSDLVTMVGENRILAHFGLKQLNENPCKGLAAMINLSNLEPGHISIDDIVFKIGPRINAAGRMESGRLAVELLKATDEKAAMRIGAKINENNNDRKNIDREITQEALEMVQSGKCLAHENVTIVYNPKWSKGVVGIVASRLVEAYYKPTVVLTKSNGFVTGSARSVAGFDLYEAIENCADLLENFGGHVYAAGLTLKEENVPEFARRMDGFIAGKITAEMLIPIVEVDAKLDFAQITPKFSRLLKQFQPFGPGNNNPIFMTENVYDAGSGRKVGAGGVHLKLDLIQESQPYHQIPSIAFNMADYITRSPRSPSTWRTTTTISARGIRSTSATPSWRITTGATRPSSSASATCANAKTSCKSHRKRPVSVPGDGFRDNLGDFLRGFAVGVDDVGRLRVDGRTALEKRFGIGEEGPGGVGGPEPLPDGLQAGAQPHALALRQDQFPRFGFRQRSAAKGEHGHPAGRGLVQHGTQRLQFNGAEGRLAAFEEDFRDGPAGPGDDFRVQVHETGPEPLRERPARAALAAAHETRE